MDKEELIRSLRMERIIKTKRVLEAFIRVPREEFVPNKYRKYAYEDTPLPIYSGQTISAPHMCAIMCEELKLSPGEIVLEIGTGSGYHAALCADIVSRQSKDKRGHVYSIEFLFNLSKFALENLKNARYDEHVTVINGDGSFNVPFRIKFDKILVTAAAPEIPRHLIGLLKPGGSMVVPVGGSFFQTLYLIKKGKNGKIRVYDKGGCLFVKLRGIHGFKEY